MAPVGRVGPEILVKSLVKREGTTVPNPAPSGSRSYMPLSASGRAAARRGRTPRDRPSAPTAARTPTSSTGCSGSGASANPFPGGHRDRWLASRRLLRGRRRTGRRRQDSHYVRVVRLRRRDHRGAHGRQRRRVPRHGPERGVPQRQLWDRRTPRAGFPWGIDVGLPGIDVQSVTLHEHGHSLGLGHFGPFPRRCDEPRSTPASARR